MNLESISHGQQHHYVKICHINVNNYLFRALPVVKRGIINAALKIFRFLRRCCWVLFNMSVLLDKWFLFVKGS